MSDLVGNTEDRFSQNEAHTGSHYDNTPMQYTANSRDCKYQLKMSDFFSSLLKTKIVDTR